MISLQGFEHRRHNRIDMRGLVAKTFLSFWLLSAVAWAAQKHALLIGISHYIPGQRLDDLAGPGPDVAAIAAALDRDFGFPKENVRILRDAEASRQGILDALDQLIARVSPGDYVFIYYSGHGTSLQGIASQGLPINGDTGAIILQGIPAAAH
jgi:Caspase domain